MVELFTKCAADYGPRLRLDEAAQNPSAATSRYMGRRVVASGKEYGQPAKVTQAVAELTEASSLVLVT